MKENELFFAIDLIKEELKEAYATSDENTMANHLLLKENELFFAIDLIKEELKEAYATSDENTMANHLTHIVEICNATKNEHFKWFSNLILKHWKGLISHAILRLSNGKIEGINNRIKTVRRMSYGFRDDEYFFLKTSDENTMANHLTHIVEICNATKNEHFKWFSNLILKHWKGLISHAILRLSNGKIEGINNRIKTVRRMSYGFRDDEYFFLKLIDMSRSIIESKRFEECLMVFEMTNISS